MNPIPTRFLKEVGTIAYLRRYWDDKSPCQQGMSYHNAMVELTRSYTPNDWALGGKVSEIAEELWPTQCKDCAKPVPEGTDYQILHKRLYRAVNGEEIAYDQLKVGDLFFINIDRGEEHDCHSRWTNCDGNHLHCVLPGNHHWDIDGRCSNCTKREDTLHRCWVRHGDPRKGEPVHVDKNGLTCAAGAGSIVVPGFHGFLHSGYITGC